MEPAVSVTPDDDGIVVERLSSGQQTAVNNSGRQQAT